MVTFVSDLLRYVPITIIFNFAPLRVVLHPKTTYSLRMDSNQIQSDSDLDVTIYHIVIQIRYEYEFYRIYSNTNLIEYKYKTDRFDLSMILYGKKCVTSSE